MSYENLKIGKLAQTVLKPLIISKATKQEISKMQELEYSKATFGIQYPLLLKTTSSVVEKHYYSDLFTIYGETYRLCCEWYETEKNNDRPYVEKWIKEHETIVTEASTDFFEDFEEDDYEVEEKNHKYDEDIRVIDTGTEYTRYRKVNGYWRLEEFDILSGQKENVIGKGQYSKRSLMYVKIPESVKGIESHAFYSCDILEEVIIPKSVKYIGESAFESCKNLKEIVIPEGVKYIGESAFESCENLKEIVIPKGVKQISSGAFRNCKNLRKVVIPDSVKRIDSWSFYLCENLREVIIPGSVEYIGESAFESCKSLREIIIPDSVRIIEQCCFHSCKSLEKVYLSDCLEYLGVAAFTYCTNLQSINIPYDIIILPRQFVYGCENLKKIDVSNGYGSKLKVIMSEAFAGCEQLSYFPGDNFRDLRVIEESAFQYCKNLIFSYPNCEVKKIAQQLKLKLEEID